MVSIEEWRSAMVEAVNTCGKDGHTAQLGKTESGQTVAVLETANASTASDVAFFMVTACDLHKEEARNVRDSEGKKCEEFVCLVIDCSRANGRLLLDEGSGGWEDTMKDPGSLYRRPPSTVALSRPLHLGTPH